MKTITKNEYLMALGLFQLAKEQEKRVVEYLDLLHDILSEDKRSGSHIDDAVYCYGDTDSLEECLRKMKIEIIEE